MKVRCEQLSSQLAKSLAPVYYISGDEPLQLGEAADLVRQHAKERGYGDRELFEVDKGFDWNALLMSSDSPSLFAQRRLLELRMADAKPGAKGADALKSYAAHPADDAVLLITSGKTDRAVEKCAWFRALDKIGVVVQVWPVQFSRFPDWVDQRMRRGGLAPTRDAAKLLAERSEGNMLAAAQEIEKLHLVFGQGEIDEQKVAQVVADCARFSLFDLSDAVLQGEPARAVKVLQGLRMEGVEPVLVLWVLSREVRSLVSIGHARLAGAAPGTSLQKAGVWSARQPLVERALKRLSLRGWSLLLGRCAAIDRVIKGAQVGSAWDELLSLSMAMAGAPVSIADTDNTDNTESQWV